MFHTVYDVLEEGVGFAPAVFLLVALLGVAIGLAALRTSLRTANKPRSRILVAGMILWTILLGSGAANLWLRRARCVSWAERGDFHVIEGPVTDFVPMPRSGHAKERFTVNGTTFSYSDFDLSQGGFNNTAAHGGPIHSGLVVRIHHHDTRILKLEVRNGQ